MFASTKYALSTNRTIEFNRKICKYAQFEFRRTSFLPTSIEHTKKKKEQENIPFLSGFSVARYNHKALFTLNHNNSNKITSKYNAQWNYFLENTFCCIYYYFNIFAYHNTTETNIDSCNQNITSKSITELVVFVTRLQVDSLSLPFSYYYCFYY